MSDIILNEDEKDCTFHTEFYPEGYQKYMHYQFLFTSDHEEVIRSILSCDPVFLG
jgi:hypothetical protein